MKFETQVQALRTICTASRNGQETVDGHKMATYMDLAAATAPLNNAFFVYVGLIEKVGKGIYKPTPLALQFASKWTFDHHEAARLLAPKFEQTWFYEAVKNKVEVNPKTTVKQMVDTLASYAGTDNSYALKFSFTLDWLAFVGLISMEGAIVQLTGEVSAEPEPDDDEVVVTHTEDNASVAPLPMLPPVKEQAPVVAFSFEVSFTATDLAVLNPDQIAALFDGAGKVAAIQAVLRQN